MAVNYWLKGLAEKGAIKVQNFRTSTSKMRYAFVLIPSGIAERASLTAHYLKRHLKEYQVLWEEIESLDKERASPDTRTDGARI
ncbi:MarR family EPS-associated transcriptional regulator [Pseudogemmobacter sp. W21_MBD1_M6]|uniref:MarR family EPS-associated transcriptional regulator n=1 Tax=Pseudogemmobacter sp. W21_MBD1_M6 TaxID=3240271 RepID=UPI003F9E1125